MSVVTVSYSEIEAARQCFHKHDLAYKDRWTRPTTSPALVTGTQWHTILEIHYGEIRAGYDPRPLVKERLDEWAADAVIDDDKYDLLEWMYKGYVGQWGFDTDWTVWDIEHKFELDLPLSPSGLQFRFKGFIDLVVRDGRGLWWIIDHKSGARGPSEKELDLSDQFVMYAWALRQTAGIEAHGCIHSYANTKMNKDTSKQSLDSRFKRTRIARTDKEMDLAAAQIAVWAEKAWTDETSVKSPNEDTCNYRCDFKDACLAGRRGVDEYRFLADTGFAQVFDRHG